MVSNYEALLDVARQEEGMFRVVVMMEEMVTPLFVHEFGPTTIDAARKVILAIHETLKNEPERMLRLLGAEVSERLGIEQQKDWTPMEFMRAFAEASDTEVLRGLIFRTDEKDLQELYKAELKRRGAL